MIGGTAFVGRHITEAALAAGHDVTVFHRGETGSTLFPQVTHLTGDRNSDLSALAEGNWDATVDVCAYFPRQVQSLAAALGGRGGRHVYISSVSAYSPDVPFGYDESAPLAEVTEPDAQTVTNENYGGLKVACERLATELYGPETTIIRPTYVIGPHDRTYRFTWWVDRIGRGGNVLAPGNPDDPIQLIDGRDMAAWIVGLLGQSVTGTFHAVNPEPTFTWRQMLADIESEVGPAGTELTWVPSDFLVAEGVTDAEMPLWPMGETEGADLMNASPAAAFATGLRPRPLRETIADLHTAIQAAGGGKEGIGTSAERDAGLLARWAAKNG
jgi:nucleoside-diphosphate-sugar epimerase